MTMKSTTTTYGVFGIAAIVAILAVSAVAFSASQAAVAAPANKAMFTAQDVTVIPNTYDTWATIISGTIKTSSPSD